MCGICGMVSFQPEHPADQFVLQQTDQSLPHRGPDKKGYYQGSPSSRAMRRLSIIDLQNRQQTISNESGDMWVVYYWAGQDKLVFAAELKAVSLHPDVPWSVNPGHRL